MPQFMSTHPNDANRLKKLQEFLPEARTYYAPAHEAQSPPPPGIPAAMSPLAAPAAPAVPEVPKAGSWIPAP